MRCAAVLMLTLARARPVRAPVVDGLDGALGHGPGLVDLAERDLERHEADPEERRVGGRLWMQAEEERERTTGRRFKSGLGSDSSELRRGVTGVLGSRGLLGCCNEWSYDAVAALGGGLVTWVF